MSCQTHTQTDMAPLICQSALPAMPWMIPGGLRLPGLSPVAPEDWLRQDEAFAAQMAYCDHLIKTKRDVVYKDTLEADAGARELLNCLADELLRQPGYSRNGQAITRPDGISIDTATKEPLLAARRLVQEDLTLLQKQGDIHRLVAGLVCFPSNWTLGEKIGKTLGEVHAPVPEFDAQLTVRTERIFAHLRPSTPLQRINTLIYTDPDLHQPTPETTAKTLTPGAARYVRMERQTLRKLERTGMIVFAIHTSLVPAAALPPEAVARLAALCPELF